MIDPNPVPTIPRLGADNAVDLEDLGPLDLDTYIWYPGIADGDLVVLNWRGCGNDGEVIDEFNYSVDVIGTPAPPGQLAPIRNQLLHDLRDGWVFYSYQVKKPGAPAPGDESLRRFFYVGKRPRAKPPLPVLQIRESHDRHLDVSNAPLELGVYAAPYEAMAAGDIVTLHCRRYESDGSEYPPALAYETEVTAADVGKPLALYLPRSDLRRVEGGRIELNYGIQYVGTGVEKTVSATQTIQLVAPTSARLPALTIVGHDSGPINPNPILFPNGLPLRIAAYPGISVDDEVLCYAYADEADDVKPLILQTRVDVSTIDKGFIDFLLDLPWVIASTRLDLQYQFAWTGIAQSATPYPATVRRPLYLPMAIVVGARPGDDPVDGEGELDAANLGASGVSVEISAEANYGRNDKVVMHWDGYGNTGRYETLEPTVPGGRTFNIPLQYIPANFEKKVPVYYSVTPDGEHLAQDSEIFVVRVLRVPLSHYQTIQSSQAQGTGGKISVSKVPGEGEQFSFPNGWPYLRAGQTLNAILEGKSAAGGEDLTVPIFDHHEITQAEADSKVVSTYLGKADLQKFQLGVVSVYVTVTYEPGAETKYEEARFTLEA